MATTQDGSRGVRARSKERCISRPVRQSHLGCNWQKKQVFPKLNLEAVHSIIFCVYVWASAENSLECRTVSRSTRLQVAGICVGSSQPRCVHRVHSLARVALASPGYSTSDQACDLRYVAIALIIPLNLVTA